MGFGRGAILARDDKRREPAEGRQAGAAALLRLLAVEALRIAGEQSANHRMFRLPGLHQARPRRPPRPARPVTCWRSWNVRSAARGSPFDEADIGIDDADERQQRKIMALGDELRADDDIAGALRDGIELRRSRSVPPGKSDESTSARACGKSLATSSASRSTPGPQGGQRVDISHSGQGCGTRSIWPQ